MPTITSPGIGSGLDVNAIVKSLVEAEGAPKQALLDRRESGYQVQLSSLGSMTSALSSFRNVLSGLNDLSDFQKRSAESSHSTLFTASASEQAVSGNYEVEVLSLAASHKVSSAGFASSEADVGTGTMTISVGAESMTLTIDDSNKTLAGIRAAINDASDNPGVTATIVQVDDGLGGTESRLVLSASESGTANAVSVSVTGDGDGNDTDAAGLSKLVSANLSDLRAAVDAQVKIDSLSVTADGNKISDAIEGVTLDLATAEPGTLATLTIGLQKNGVKSLIGDLVKAYNSAADTLDELTRYDAASGATGGLFGDSMVRNLENQLYRKMGDPVEVGNSPLKNLSSIGLSFSREGKLELDSAKLDVALESNYDDVGKLFAGDDGIAARLDDYLGGYLDSGGVLKSRTTGLSERIEDVSDDRLRLADRLVRVEARYRAQYQALDLIMSQMQSTSSYLSQQLSNLPGYTNNNS